MAFIDSAFRVPVHRNSFKPKNCKIQFQLPSLCYLPSDVEWCISNFYMKYFCILLWVKSELKSVR